MLTRQTSGKIIILYNTSKSLLISSIFPNHFLDSAKFPLRGIKFGGGKLSRPGGTDSISHHSSSSGAPASPHCLEFRGGTRTEAELQCLPSNRSPYSRPEPQIFNASQGKAQIQSTKKENGAVSTKAHCFCLCLPELSTVYQNGNRWHKANACTFSQFPTKRTDVFITCYMTAFNKM